jgi:hypothetical protein
MRVYRKKYKNSESFPVERGDTWQVRERGKVVESWVVVDARREFFLAEVTEYFEKGAAPRPREQS